jgi:hypothetical protein
MIALTATVWTISTRTWLVTTGAPRTYAVITVTTGSSAASGRSASSATYTAVLASMIAQVVSSTAAATEMNRGCASRTRATTAESLATSGNDSPRRSAVTVNNAAQSASAPITSSCGPREIPASSPIAAAMAAAATPPQRSAIVKCWTVRARAWSEGPCPVRL